MVRSVAACTALVFLAVGCGGGTDIGLTYGCTEDGARTLPGLQEQMKKVGPSPRRYENCGAEKVAGVKIDPFRPDTTLESVEAVFADRFECTPPQRNKETASRRTSIFRCTVNNLSFGVELSAVPGRVWADVQPNDPDVSGDTA